MFYYKDWTENWFIHLFFHPCPKKNKKKNMSGGSRLLHKILGPRSETTRRKHCLILQAHKSFFSLPLLLKQLICCERTKVWFQYQNFKKHSPPQNPETIFYQMNTGQLYPNIFVSVIALLPCFVLILYKFNQPSVRLKKKKSPSLQLIVPTTLSLIDQTGRL